MQINDQLDSLLRERHIGQIPRYAASSCREILQLQPQSQSGNYWLRNPAGNEISAYCNMQLTCGPANTSGWMRIASFNLSDQEQTCPNGNFQESMMEQTRYCTRSSATAGCDGSTFNVSGFSYTSVCGRASGVQIGTVDSFNIPGNPSIDGTYVDGISLTYSEPTNQRVHIWTFGASLSEQFLNCPCSVGSMDMVPEFVGFDYFCEAASMSDSIESIAGNVFTEDLLWDGRMCRGVETSCCSTDDFNPPWFYRNFTSEINSDIEMRMCVDHNGENGGTDENLGLQGIEVYIQ